MAESSDHGALAGPDKTQVARTVFFVFLLTFMLGGPTVLLEIGGFRLLPDPTFDPAGTEYATSLYTLRETENPAVPVDQLGPVDPVLLSHDHHFDNLDHAGKQMLANVGTVPTTRAGAERLKANAIGLPIAWIPPMPQRPW